MKAQNFLNIVVLGVAMIAAPAVSGAQGQDHGHDNDHGQYQDRGNGNDRGPQGGPDYHFRPDDRNNFRGHYQNNLRQWQNNPRRPHFNRGDRLPSNYRIQAVPSSYYRGVPPPPPGYRFGYYDGYVVSYNPATRIIADVLDLVTGN